MKQFKMPSKREFQAMYPPENDAFDCAVRATIDALPEKERKTILLRFFKGLTQEQTARILQVSQVQVSRLERRSLQKLGDLLAEE